MFQQRMVSDVQEYVMFKKELLHVERIMLRTFGFVLHVDHPHKFVLNYLNILKAGPELKQEAWNLANDRCGSLKMFHLEDCIKPGLA